MYIKHSQTSLNQPFYEHTLNNARKQEEIEKSVHQDCTYARLATCRYIDIEKKFFFAVIAKHFRP